VNLSQLLQLFCPSRVTSCSVEKLKETYKRHKNGINKEKRKDASQRQNIEEKDKRNEEINKIQK
jgi:hypothetical protein